MLVERGKRITRPRRAGDGLPAPVGEQGAETFAAGEQLARCVGEDAELVGDRIEMARALVEEAGDPGVNQVN